MTICTLLVNFEQSFLIRFDSLVATWVSDNVTKSIMESIDHMNIDSAMATFISNNKIEASDHMNVTYVSSESMYFCKCPTEMNRSLRVCQSSEISAKSTAVIHCNSGGHGMFMILLNTSLVSNLSEHIGAFVRVNGPLIDSIFLTWSDSDLLRPHSALGGCSVRVSLTLHFVHP